MNTFLSMLKLLAVFGTLAVSSFTIAGFLGRHHWFLELFSHFRVQYFVLLLIAVLFFLFIKSWRWAAVTLIGVLVNASLLLPLFFGGPPQSLESLESREKRSGHTLRFLNLNLYQHNRRLEDVIAFTVEKDPDILILQEYTPQAQRIFGELKDSYPERVEIPIHSPFGMAIFSKTPFASQHVLPGDISFECPWIHVQLTLAEDTTINVLGLHPPPPGDALMAAERNQIIQAAARYVRERDEHPWLVAGDFNASPWSFIFKDFLAATKLVDSMKGRGLHFTWPSSISPQKTIIDYVLLSEGIAVNSRIVGPDLGSDHLPQIVEITIPEK